MLIFFMMKVKLPENSLDVYVSKYLPVSKAAGISYTRRVLLAVRHLTEGCIIILTCTTCTTDG